MSSGTLLAAWLVFAGLQQEFASERAEEYLARDLRERTEVQMGRLQARIEARTRARLARSNRVVMSRLMAAAGLQAE